MFCKNCGNKLNENEKFCPNCGMVVESNLDNPNISNIPSMNNNLNNSNMSNDLNNNTQQVKYY